MILRKGLIWVGALQVCFCLMSGPLIAHEGREQDSKLSLRIDTVYRWIRGTTEVDEFDVEGTRLNLNEDFDIEPTAGLRLGLSKSWDRLRLDAEDDNQFDLRSPSISLGLEYRF